MDNDKDTGDRDVRILSDDWMRSRAAFITQPLVRGLARLNLHPNAITIAGFLLNVGAAAIVATGRVAWGGLATLLASSTDALDGTLARLTAKQSRFGAFLDSTLDRLSEGVVFLGLVVYFIGEGAFTGVYLTTLALLGSVMVSYTRARAEGLGYTCKVGLLTRPIRVLILGVGMLTPWLVPTLVLLVVLTWVTVLQRVMHVYRESRRQP